MLPHPVVVEGLSAGNRRWCSAGIALAIILAVLLEHLAAQALTGRHVLPQRWALHLLDAAAASRLYQDPALFEPWQPWSHAVLQADLWQLVAMLAVWWPVAGAIEGELGAAVLLAALLAILPVAAAGGLAGGGEVGLGGGCAGLLALLWVRHPRARVRWGISYYALIEVGHLRLFAVSLPVLAALAVIQELARCWWTTTPPALLAWLCGAVVGALLGMISRRLRPPHPAPPVVTPG